MDAPGVPPPVSRAAFAEADTQPFQIVKRSETTPRRNRPALIRLSIAFASAVSIVAAIFLVKSLTSATPAAPDENHPAQSVSIVASPVSSATPDPTELVVEPPTKTPTVPQPTATATIAPSATATVAPSPTSTEVPTEIPSATATATSTATPTEPQAPIEPATTGIFTGEIVKNGSFEDGDAEWYLEEGARSAGINAREGQRALILPAKNGYADQTVTLVPGASYTLTASGLLGSDTDTGEVSIRFKVAAGEPQPVANAPTLTFTGTSYSQQSLTFVVPEHVVDVKLVIWKPSGSGIFAVDALSLRAETPTTDVEAES